MKDPYEALQVHRGAEPEVIHAAFRALARKYHPDFGGDVGRMASITAAWAILSNPDRRAVYDAEFAKSRTRRTSDRKTPASTAVQAPNVARTGPIRSGTGTVIDFGRYIGWTIGALVDHDPDYLEWLQRTPIGRRLSPEIDAALAVRASRMAAALPSVRPLTRRRSFSRPFASARCASR